MSIKSYRPTKATKKQLIVALRLHVIWSVTQPGMPTGDKPIAYKCQLCGAEWPVRKPEKHTPGCVLA